jgi:hypothetical protein
MADAKIRVNRVQSCNLGKLGSDGVALKINFATSATGSNGNPNKTAVFGLSHKLARGLAKALTSILDETAKSAKN